MSEPRPWRVDPAVIKRLFGKASRVALASWILSRQDRAFYATEAQRDLVVFDIAPSGVTKDLEDFVKSGMLQRVPDGGKVYFNVVSNDLWRAFEAIVMATQSVESPPHNK